MKKPFPPAIKQALSRDYKPNAIIHHQGDPQGAAEAQEHLDTQHLKPSPTQTSQWIIDRIRFGGLSAILPPLKGNSKKS